ncbi:hypothetical protein [Alcaligenes faecalis]|uniref:hypothetical protein n=1 Tax=Alcaligenes faecalis TaxID=511 RepID=UPI001D020EA4|nr:hypothetical protein [Alcaligenes faecalis]
MLELFAAFFFISVICFIFLISRYNPSFISKENKGRGMRVIVFVAALLLTGCASITSESMQLVRVDAVDETGEKVTDARCTLTNDKGEFVTEAGKHARVGKSSKNLNVTCTATDRTDEATGTLISRAGAGMFGNIIFGGGIGAIIDHNRGTAYNYPDWVELVFGKILTYDRMKNKEGVPMKEGDQVVEPNKTNETVAAATP